MDGAAKAGAGVIGVAGPIAQGAVAREVAANDAQRAVGVDRPAVALGLVANEGDAQQVDLAAAHAEDAGAAAAGEGIGDHQVGEVEHAAGGNIEHMQVGRHAAAIQGDRADDGDIVVDHRQLGVGVWRGQGDGLAPYRWVEDDDGGTGVIGAFVIGNAAVARRFLIEGGLERFPEITFAIFGIVGEQVGIYGNKSG